MKLLMVAIPNHHFFQWVNQLKHSDYEVYWFDITDGGPKSSKIEWVTQIKGWKLKWNFPFRTQVKKKLPKLYSKIQKVNETDVTNAFKKALEQIQPDLVHCFEMKLSGLPILPVMSQNKIPLIYSSWGSDLFYYKQHGVNPKKVNTFIKRIDLLISDCKRDVDIIQCLGYRNPFYVLPGNGGLAINTEHIKKTNQRKNIIFKGYQYDVGEAIQIVKALEIVAVNLLKNMTIHCYSADVEVIDYIKQSDVFKLLDYTIYPRHQRLDNKKLLKIMGSSVLHLGNNLSDGMPNALLEAMAMGAFPIQSNPGGATEEVINDGVNGFLIHNPLDFRAIATLIEQALQDEILRVKAQEYNINFINKNYKRSILQPTIVQLYQKLKNN
ncbi:glycosyltransferase [Olleya sp.]|uniref:glycosyltransferase n=1 Tax=Olleya sp. TaxID=1906788 RepID=UPI0032D97F37